MGLKYLLFEAFKSRGHSKKIWKWLTINLKNAMYCFDSSRTEAIFLEKKFNLVAQDFH